MSHWATRRKLTYIGAFFSFLFIVIALPTFFFVYKPPTCFDGKQNQGEDGVDCGGSCSLLCKAQALRPIVLWQRAFKVTPGLYNAVAYVENPNIESGAKNVSYRFQFYDEKGLLLSERAGKTDIPPNRIFPIFEDRIKIEGSVPTRTIFELSPVSVWEKDLEKRADVRVEKQYLEEKDFPQVFASIQNRGVAPLYKLPVVAIVYDSNENAIAASRTFIDVLPKNSSKTVTFTWPEELNLGVGVCEKPADVILAIDRSGSMDDDQASPPEPFTSVKHAAQSFIDSMKDGDRIGVISFGTNASHPPDQGLTSDFGKAKEIIEALSIKTGGEQNTNIADAILNAGEEFKNAGHVDSLSGDTTLGKRAIVLLTDGIPNYPQKENEPDYPQKSALQIAEGVKAEEVGLYVVGLGDKVQADFLKAVASSPEAYFAAEETADLPKIYSSIASSICKMGPSQIQIIPLIP